MLGRTNTGGGGGAALNFKVVRYDPGAELPASAAENTISVFTNVDITRWYFSPTQPENMKQGEVWFSTGVSSAVAFNALKKNDIEVCPISAKQYVNGELVSVEAKTYKSGEWKSWIVYVYKNGIEYTDVAKFVASGGEDNIQFNATDITVRPHNVKIAHGRWATTGKVDLSKFSTLVMNLSGQTPYGGMCGFGVAPSAPTGTNPSTSAFTSLRTAGMNQEMFEGVYTCDISAVNSGYIFFGGAKTETGVDSGGGSITMTETYLW